MRREKQKPVKPGNRRFSISANITITVFTEVDATSEKEARELALDRSVQTLCHQCSGGDASQEWSLTGDLDGEVDDEHIVDVIVDE